jgi:hypothetical protein
MQHDTPCCFGKAIPEDRVSDELEALRKDHLSRYEPTARAAQTALRIKKN